MNQEAVNTTSTSKCIASIVTCGMQWMTRALQLTMAPATR